MESRTNRISKTSEPIAAEKEFELLYSPTKDHDPFEFFKANHQLQVSDTKEVNPVK